MFRFAKQLTVFFCSLLVSRDIIAQIPSTYQKGTWKDFKPAALSYTFDDNLSSQYSAAQPLFDNFGFKMTYFTVSQSFNPNWTSIKAAAAKGHEIASHTVTHADLSTSTATNQDNELKNSQSTIQSQVTGKKCVTVAYPNCNVGDVATVQKYYIAGRVCSGQVISNNPTDFYRLSSVVCGTQGDNSTTAMNNRATSAKSSSGWMVYLMHEINSGSGYSPLQASTLSSHLDFVNTNKADYWVGTFGDVVKYIKERNAISFTETAVSADSLRINPTDGLDNTIYDVAVSIRRQLPTNWTNARVRLGSTLVSSSIVTINSVKYIQFEVTPDAGIYSIANPSVNNGGGCTTVAPTVTATVNYELNATAAQLTASGTSLKWYTTATGETAATSAPTPSTTAVGTTVYYVSQTLNNCESSRASISVVVSSGSTSGGNSCTETGQGAYHTGVYRNMFKELLNKTDQEVSAKVNNAFQQIFYGNTSQKLYYEVGTDQAYILDVNNNDVRSEGMSYGMMICVQLNKQAEFNKLWRWTKNYMQYTSGNYNGYFRWQLNTNGTVKGDSPASDGEAYFITALFFAANRWGNGSGILNYEAEAQDILSKVMSKTGAGSVYNLFNTNSKLITFVPYGDSYGFTDPSYNLPGFWELWKRWSKTNTSFWAETPELSRKLIRDASHPTSGLTTDYSEFDGRPKEVSYNLDADKFMYDAWRTIMNLGMDYHWFKADAQQPVIADRYLTFFKNQGANYKNHYNWDGTGASGDHSTGLVACNAVASLATTNTTLSTPFVQEFWNVAIPTGTYRYYDGMLYMLALLNCSGDFKVWKPCVVTKVADQTTVDDVLTVYPNPTNGVLNIKNINEDYNFTILNNLGAVVMAGKADKTINVESLSKGIYFLNINYNDISKTIKVVVE